MLARRRFSTPLVRLFPALYLLIFLQAKYTHLRVPALKRSISDGCPGGITGWTAAGNVVCRLSAGASVVMVKMLTLLPLPLLLLLLVALMWTWRRHVSVVTSSVTIGLIPLHFPP